VLGILEYKPLRSPCFASSSRSVSTKYELLIPLPYREDEMGETCSSHSEVKNTYGVLVGKPEGKRPLGGPKTEWNDSIKTLLKQDVRVRTGFIWFRIGNSGGLL
jgi:hypothetical protein